MTRPTYWGMTRLEWGLTFGHLLLITVVAVGQTLRSRQLPYREFMQRAEQIGRALEAFAADHGGRYPSDGIHNHPPPGLSPKYIEWSEEWNIDYEVHDNGRGGNYVALEFLGRYEKDRSFSSSGLTRDPEKRKRYGRGQPIPGSLGRIWVFYEEAPILQP